jgi:hypothetical protein
MTGCYVQVNGARWPAADFLAGRAVALALPATRARALAELVAVVATLDALERGAVDEEEAA